MPVDPTTKSKLKRRSSRREIDECKFDGTHARELEMKRNRGEVSCAECRRLKIKCDKRIPCQSCQRRGCAALCPNGSLATGQGTRFVLAATEHLHRRIGKLRERIRQLEGALGTLQAKQSSEPHPLLREDLLTVAGGEDGLAAEDGSMDEDGGGGSVGSNPNAEVLEVFGTLSISDHGISRFFGPTGGSESLLMASNDGSPASTHSPDSVPTSDVPPVSASIKYFSRNFPFTPLGNVDDTSIIQEKLPAWERANILCNSYFEQAGWLFHGVTKDQVYEDMLPAIYRKKTERQQQQQGGISSLGSTLSSPASSTSSPYVNTSPISTTLSTSDNSREWTSPHAYALLFSLFAVGSLVETDPVPGEAEHLHQISMAALGLQSVLEKPSIVTIQALHLLSIFNAMSGADLVNDTSMEMTWSLIYLAAHLSQSIGLHRDSARWGLTPKMIERRRILFWDLFVADSWTSLNTGRPPSFSLAYIDCGFPSYSGEGKEPNADINSSFESWGFRFAAEVVAEVAARTLTAEAPSYATIMELDKKVRDFPLPTLGGATSTPSSTTTAVAGSASGTQGQKGQQQPRGSFASEFMRCVLDHTRETILLYIHRSFFAQAIIDQPANPLKSAYAPSFLAAYRASTTILKSVKEQFRTWPVASACFWSMWTFAFSAAVVFGTVVTRGPKSPLASSAMGELEQACILFSKAAQYSKRARKALPILIKLSEKARHALATAQAEASAASSVTGAASEASGGLLWSIKQEDTGDDELDIFAGRTRFVSTKKSGVPSSGGSEASWTMPYETSGQPVYAHDPHSHSSLQLYPPTIPAVPPVPATVSTTQCPQQQPMQVPHQPSTHPSTHVHHPHTQTHGIAVYPTSQPSSHSHPLGVDPWPSTITERRPSDPYATSHPQTRMFTPPDSHSTASVPISRSHQARVASSSTSGQFRQQPPPIDPYAHPPQSHDRSPVYMDQLPTPTSYEWPETPSHPHPLSNPHLQHSQSRHQHPQAMHPYNHYSHGHHDRQPSHHQPQHQVMYTTTPAFHGSNLQPAHPELAALGLAARDSRLDARWSSFMQDSGILEDVDMP
ncbi:hypothetical protein ONZ45_g8546 [Pleurotus djamor]|nr:hypothetical protein ONZ45_g8546 [Pleurotus djamor]